MLEHWVLLWELGKGNRNVRTIGMAVKTGRGDLQIEECDASASPNTESPSETRDSEADPNYSLSDDSYTGTTGSNSSSLHEVSVSASNEPQNVDLTAERENRNQRAEKGKRP